MTPRPESVWTPAAIALLRTMHEEGLNFRAIAEGLNRAGVKVTRNSAIGKAQRLMLPKRPTIADHTATKPKREPKPRLRKQNGPGVIKAVPAPPLVPVVNAARSGLLVDLDVTTCHWPVKEIAHATFLYCTADAAHGPYCAFHHAAGHEPVKGRSR